MVIVIIVVFASVFLEKPVAAVEYNDNYGILTVTVKDGVTGNWAKGVELTISNESGIVEKVSLPDPINQSSSIHFWLTPGTYRITVTENILGVQWTLYDQQVQVPKAEQKYYITVTAVVVPLEYVPWLCGAAIAISAALISLGLIRKFVKRPMKLPKNVPPQTPK
jgi:hypothetical protein